MINHSTLWFLLINFLISYYHFWASVDAETLQWLPLFLMALHLLHHLQSLQPLKMLLFSNLWMRWEPFPCGRLTLSSTYFHSTSAFHNSISSSFMDSDSSLSISVLHICIYLHHHLSNLLCLYLNTPTFTTLCTWRCYTRSMIEQSLSLEPVACKFWFPADIHLSS